MFSCAKLITHGKYSLMYVNKLFKARICSVTLIIKKNQLFFMSPYLIFVVKIYVFVRILYSQCRVIYVRTVLPLCPHADAYTRQRALKQGGVPRVRVIRIGVSSISALVYTEYLFMSSFRLRFVQKSILNPVFVLFVSNVKFVSSWSTSQHLSNVSQI